MAKILPFPKRLEHCFWMHEFQEDILHTTLELAIYQSMREKGFQRIIFDFFLLSQADQKALKKRSQPYAIMHTDSLRT